MKSLTRQLLGVELICAASFGAHAATLFDTLGTGDEYWYQNAWSLGNAVEGFNYANYSQVTVSESGFLTSATAPLAWFHGAKAPILFEVRADNNGSPGSIIEQISVAPVAPMFTDENRGYPFMVSGIFSGSAWLSSQNKYWFGMAVTDPTSNYTWSQNGLGRIGPVAFAGAAWQQPGAWFLQSAHTAAFRLDGTLAAAVPEPGSAALTLAGLAWLGMSAARRRNRQD